MKKIVKKSLVYLIAALFIVASFAFSISALPTDSPSGFAGETDKAEIYKDPGGRIMSCSRKGDWHTYPENSLEAVLSAEEIGADIIEIDIKKTKDGNLILMEDETVTRTCYNINTDKTLVSEMTLNEIVNLKLLSKQGGAIAEQTGYSIPRLAEVINTISKSLLLLDFDWTLRDDVYTLAKESGKLGSVILLTRTKPAEVKQWVDSLSEKPMTMGYFKGNVVFSATSYVKGFMALGGDAVFMTTNNPYGMNFQEVVTGKFTDKGRAAASPATPELCGQKTDSEIWWNDLADRGYSIIITDFPRELVNYIKKTLTAMDSLIALKAQIDSGFTMPQAKDIVTDFSRSYNKATENAKSLISRGFAGETTLLDACYQLQSSVDNIELHYSEITEGKSGVTITLPRIIIVILAVTAVVSAQVYTFKKRKKK